MPEDPQDVSYRYKSGGKCHATRVLEIKLFLQELVILSKNGFRPYSNMMCGSINIIMTGPISLLLVF